MLRMKRDVGAAPDPHHAARLLPPQVYGGMRGMKGLVYETSVLDPDEVSVSRCCHVLRLQH